MMMIISIMMMMMMMMIMMNAIMGFKPISIDDDALGIYGDISDQ